MKAGIASMDLTSEIGAALRRLPEKYQAVLAAFYDVGLIPQSAHEVMLAAGPRELSAMRDNALRELYELSLRENSAVLLCVD